MSIPNSHQPHAGNAQRRLNERKIVKTISLKKVAVVAVASLGFGLTSVVPANADAINVTNTAVATAPTVATTIATPAPVGSAITATINTILAAAATAAASVVSTFTLTDPNGTNVTADATFTSASGAVAGVTTTNTGAAYTHTIASGATASTKATGTVVFTPKMGGVYVLKYTHSSFTSTGSADTSAGQSAITAASFYVTGSGAKIATSGVGTTTIGAQVGGIAEVRFSTAAKANSAIYNLTSSGVGTIQAVAAGDATDPATIAGISAASDYTQGAKITTAASTDMSEVIATVASTVAGTQTLTWTAISSTTGAPTVVATQAITWGAAPALSVANSKVYISAGDDSSTLSADDTVVYLASTAASTTVANIQVTLNNDAATAFNGQKLTVTVAGPGLFGVDVASLDGVTAGRTNRIYADSSANSGNTWQIGIAADGTAGTSTFTIKVGDVTVATKSLVFYGSVASYTATPVLTATANGSATTDAVVVCALDANKNPVPGATIYASSGSTAVASVAATGTTVSAAADEDLDTGSANLVLAPTAYQAAKGVGCAGFAVTGASQTTASSVDLTFRNASTVASSTVTATAKVAVGSVAATTVTLTSDKASYAAGEKMVLTLTFKDSVGRLVGAGPGTGTLDDVLKSSASLGGDALFAANNNVKNGVKTVTVYAPLQGGKLTLTGSTGTNATYLATAAQGVALSLSPTVTDPNAAIITQIDALNAKIVALNALIAKIMKKLGVK